VRTFTVALIIALVAVLFAGGLYHAPRFLVYSTGCEKADAVVVLLGPDFRARHRHAKNLVYKGMADYLVIPAYGRTYKMELGEIKIVGRQPRKNLSRKSGNIQVPEYWEDTHLELLQAREIMADYGHKSAIFVSSPYHMRRIQMIVHKVFNSPHGLYFSPTPFEEGPVNLWELGASDWKKIYREYIKIVWFQLYSLWIK
jgi:hypothetical protein